MSRRALVAALFATLVVSAGARPSGAPAGQPPADNPQATDEVKALVERLEPIVQRGDTAAFLQLFAASADRGRALSFASFELLPDVVRAVVQERDRQPLAGTLPGAGYRLVVDVFADRGGSAHISTWRLDVKRIATDPETWRIADVDRISAVDNLYRLSLNPSKQYDAHDLHIAAEDLDLVVADGTVFVGEVESGVTALVVSGHGRMTFRPAPSTERGQVKIFCGAETLDAEFDSAFIRINPADYATVVDTAHLTPHAAVDPRALRRAEEIFREESPKSFMLDLGDLSRDAWSLLPSMGDFLGEVRTRRYGTLTYAKSAAEPEDITLFDRERHRNIALYASAAKLARRGRFYSEDDLSDYDILHHDISISYAPDRLWIEGRSRLRLKVRSAGLGALTMRLADSLVVRSVVSDELGRLFGIRVRNQHMLVINLPVTLPHDAELTLTIVYAGRLEPQTPDREAIGVGQIRVPPTPDELQMVHPEPSLLYSNRSFWYPQANATDYATATIRITVPAAFDCVASGSLVPGAPELLRSSDGTQPLKLYVFEANQPLRYLAFVVSRFARAETVTVALDRTSEPYGDGLPVPTGQSNDALRVAVEANPRQVQRGHELIERAVAIAQFYTSIVGDSPYPTLTIALVESELPGGHSPAYFAELNQPLPTSPYVWRNDPAAFANFPEFFAAHEIAHQWWGQAVGWQNYHEQWLSEGFAQYFAALYAQHAHGDDTFAGILRQMRRWAVDESPQGPVYLGYRLGHIRGQSRVFRALVYNKGAIVLHMLRRLIGDEAFFRGIRRYYATSRFRKVGTDDLRAAMEEEYGHPLDRFFENWIYGDSLPRVKFSYKVEGRIVQLHAEQVGELFEVPITVTLEYADRKPVDVVLPLTERTADLAVPLAGALRSVEINKDDGSLAEIVKG
ncbi:MAG TPA: M1 family aminopeptidase [Vicinamibacterales bacterium]|jgi:hypothetical protein|nr:M1 family aminopeptidase [Vicinamibacterales bacterium]